MYTICLVEDEVSLSTLIKAYLEKAEYNVVCFTKGKDAIDYIDNKPDLWILDIMLSDDVNGYDIIKAIREKDENVPVIFTSARDQDLDRILGLELGSDDYRYGKGCIIFRSVCHGSDSFKLYWYRNSKRFTCF